MAKKTTKAASKERQKKLFETDHPSDAKLKALAGDYESARDQRIAWLDDEVQAKEKVVDHMKSKGITHYKNGDLIIDTGVKDTLKVKRVSAEAT